MYRGSFPEVDQAIRLGQYASGKDHYLQWGHNSSQMHYFCPPRCFNKKETESCTTCDKETVYLSNNPDVRKAVESGWVESGFNHWEQSGRDEGRSFSCYERFTEDGSGNNTGCFKIFEQFITVTKPVVSTWPVAGRTGAKIDPKTCKAVLLIEGREHEWMDYALRVHRRYTGPDWMFYLVAPSSVAKRWREKYSGPMVNITDLPEEFGDLSRYPLEINNAYRSKFIWEKVIQCEYVLVTQVREHATF
jgi:hypothetical protein